MEFPGECQASFDFIVCNCNKIKYRIRIKKILNFQRENTKLYNREKLRNPGASLVFIQGYFVLSFHKLLALRRGSYKCTVCNDGLLLKGLVLPKLKNVCKGM